MYCLDTNIIIDIFRGDDSLRKKLLMIQNWGADVAITTLTLCELYKGAYLASRRDEATRLIQDFLKSVVLLRHSEKSCELFGFENDNAVLTFYIHTLPAQGKLYETSQNYRSSI